MTYKICYCTDENYAPYAAVSINSALQNKNPDTDYEFIIASQYLSKDSKNRFWKLCNPTFVQINREDFQNFRCGINYISEAAAYRLIIPNSLNGKLLYVDCDTLIQEDLSELFEIDLQDNCIGAVLDCNYKTGRKRTGTINYFNSGVILFDCDKWQEGNYFERVRNELNNPVNTLPDQDALNRVLAGHVLYLPLKYNAMRFQTPRKFDYIHDTLKEYNLALKNPAIKHYISKHKPWQITYDEKEREIYLEYTSGSFFDEIYFYIKAVENINQVQLGITGYNQVQSNINQISEQVKNIYIDENGNLFNHDNMERLKV